MAFKSPQVFRGVRWLARIIRQHPRTGSPRLTILTGGMRRPSWKTSVASAANEPGALPPISARCPMLADEAEQLVPVEDRPHDHVLRDVAAAAVGVVVEDDVARLEGIDPQLLQRPPHGERIAPIWAGQNSAWPIMLPRRSNSTHEKSSPSLKIGE